MEDQPGASLFCNHHTMLHNDISGRRSHLTQKVKIKSKTKFQKNWDAVLNVYQCNNIANPF